MISAALSLQELDYDTGEVEVTVQEEDVGFSKAAHASIQNY